MSRPPEFPACPVCGGSGQVDRDTYDDLTAEAGPDAGQEVPDGPAVHGYHRAGAEREFWSSLWQATQYLAVTADA